ncbi:MAG: porin family protein [Rhizobiales bacterium]|nr:porin family protein [Hyphomicrobiales bacterium]
MRRFVVAALMTVTAQAVQAADMPDLTNLPILRGAVRDGLNTSIKNWQGYYFGGQYGYSSTNFGTPGVLSALDSLAGNTSIAAVSTLSGMQFNDKTTASAWGGFAGYNAQWTDVVLGVDVNYNFAGQQVSYVVNPAFRTLVSGPSTYNTTTSGAATMKITDYGSARFRAGWAIDCFLPYATVGVALGRADMARTINVSGTVDNGGGPVPYSATGVETKPGAFLYGYSYGGGLDLAMYKGLFMRAEVEVNRFTSAWGMEATVTSARVGAGYKF